AASRATDSGSTGRVPGLRWIRARVIHPVYPSARASISSVGIAVHGTAGNDEYTGRITIQVSAVTTTTMATSTAGRVGLTSAPAGRDRPGGAPRPSPPGPPGRRHARAREGPRPDRRPPTAPARKPARARGDAAA